MPNCAISTCKNYSRVTKGKDTAIRYFRFPSDENFRKQWVIACCRKNEINLQNARICSIHFAPDCFEIPLRQRLLKYRTTNSRILSSDAVPTLNLPNQSFVAVKVELDDINEDVENKMHSLEERLLELEYEILRINGEKNEMQRKILELENENKTLLKKVERKQSRRRDKK